MLQLQRSEMDYLDLFYSEFKLGCRMEMALIMFLDYLLKEQDKGYAFILTILDLTVALDTIYYDILLEQLWELGGGWYVAVWA